MNEKFLKVEDIMEILGIWNLESANELDNLKAEKKRAKSDMHMADVCINEELYTAYGYVDEAEKLDYGAEEVVPMMYNYQKRDIAEKFGIVENTDRGVEEQPVDASEPILEDEAYDIRESEYGTYAVSDETDKREFDVEECDMFEAIKNISETAINETVDVEDLKVHRRYVKWNDLRERINDILSSDDCKVNELPLGLSEEYEATDMIFINANIMILRLSHQNIG